MIYRLLADLTLWLHLLFVLFAVFGGLLVFRWPRLAWVHVPTFIWGGAIEIGGWTCPLTLLENELRIEGAAEGYSSSFVEHYLLPLIYPQQLFDGQFPDQGFLWLGIALLAFNGLLYGYLWRRSRRRLR